MSGIEPTNGVSGKTVAKVVAGTAAAGAAVALAVAAKKGNLVDSFQKVAKNSDGKFSLKGVFTKDHIQKGFKALGAGFTEIGKTLKDKALKGWEAVKGIFAKGKEKAEKVADKAKEKASEGTEKAAEVVEQAAQA